MGYADLGIIRARREAQKEKYQTLESGIYVKDELIQFHAVELLDGKLSIKLPEYFEEMELEMAKQKYPSEFRPKAIWTNPSGSVTFTFNFFEEMENAEELPAMAQEMRKLVERLEPANVFYEFEEKVLGDTKVIWFDYKSYGLDQQIYNFMYFVPFTQVFVQGGFNCPTRISEAWKPVVRLVVLSMEEKIQAEGEK